MGLGQHPIGARTTFGLNDLGVLDGPPIEGFTTVVDTTAQVQHADSAAFLVFDDDSSSAVFRAAAGAQPGGGSARQIPLSDSVASEVRSEGRTLVFADISKEMPESREGAAIKAAGFIASPVFGPAGEIIGALEAMCRKPVFWTDAQIKQQERMARLLSDLVMLRASMETLRLIANERHPVF